MCCTCFDENNIKGEAGVSMNTKRPSKSSGVFHNRTNKGSWYFWEKGKAFQLKIKKVSPEGIIGIG